MIKCKKCNEIISLGLEDILSGNYKAPKAVSKDSVKVGYCKECFSVKKPVLYKRSRIKKVTERDQVKGRD